MKVLIASLLLLSSLNAFASADEPKLIITCVDARANLSDAGFALTVTAGGIAGVTEARISENSISGPRDLGSFIITKKTDGLERVYKGKGFGLSITMESFVATTIHPAQLKAVLGNGRRLEADLTCTVL